MKTDRKIIQQKYRDKNKEKLRIKNKIYKELNKDKINEYNKNYKKLNKERDIKKKAQYDKNYRDKNKEILAEKKKKYAENNKDKIRVRYRIWVNNKLKNDNVFKLKCNIRSLIRSSLYRKNHRKYTKTQDILGCTFEEFKQHLESKFEPWMNWENYGLYNGELNHGWDIDHYTPLSSVISYDDIILLNHYTNLQPLCSYTNRYIKKNSIT